MAHNNRPMRRSALIGPWGVGAIVPFTISLGARCRRFESCRPDHFSKKAAKTCCIWGQNELQPLYDLRR